MFGVIESSSIVELRAILLGLSFHGSDEQSLFSFSQGSSVLADKESSAPKGGGEDTILIIIKVANLKKGFNGVIISKIVSVEHDNVGIITNQAPWAFSVFLRSLRVFKGHIVKVGGGTIKGEGGAGLLVPFILFSGVENSQDIPVSKNLALLLEKGISIRVEWGATDLIKEEIVVKELSIYAIVLKPGADIEALGIKDEVGGHTKDSDFTSFGVIYSDNDSGLGKAIFDRISSVVNDSEGQLGKIGIMIDQSLIIGVIVEVLMVNDNHISFSIIGFGGIGELVARRGGVSVGDGGAILISPKLSS